jgi:SAM-dependent methyltransferase
VNHQVKTAAWLKGIGVEIGAFKTPIDGITPIYVDKFPEFAGERCLADYYGEACSLPFYSNSLDYVASSHVLEHVANPVQAICEWYRVLRPGGIMYVVVPDRRVTWDHQRELTPVAHMLDDYARNVTDCDRTHIDDFVNNVDWSTYSPGTKPEEVAAAKQQLCKLYHGAIDAGQIINIHFHVFEPSNVIELFQAVATAPQLKLDLSILDSAEAFPAHSPSGFLIVVRANKGLSDRYEVFKNKIVQRFVPSYPVLKTARKFE